MRSLKERRKHERHDVVHLITVINRDTRREIRACFEDVSVGGASIFTHGNLLSWRNISIQLPEVNVSAEIVRDEIRGGNRVVGVKFVELGFFGKLKLKKFIDMNRK